jgi:F-type H+-transporting ATPase subunit a
MGIDMSAWVQSAIALSIALTSFVWIWLSRKREGKADGKHIGWMPVALFLVFVLYCVSFTIILHDVRFALCFVAIVIVLAVLFRMIAVPRLRETPDRKQAFLEAGVEKAAPVPSANALKSAKRIKFLQKALFLVSLWFAFGRILTAIYGAHVFSLEVMLFPETVNVLGLQLSGSIIDIWYLIAFFGLLAVLFRLFVVPRFKDNPGWIQNALEQTVEAIDKFTHGQLHQASGALTSYIFTIAALMIGSALMELLGIRPPTADLKLTLSMALVSFAMINYYGFKKKGFLGRFKSLAQPKAFMLPIRIITDLAVPVSLSCRLFGNMLGGFIVMDMLKSALGTGAIGIPPVAGLFFNLFHPFIQAYIFITLSLTFINEAVE